MFKKKQAVYFNGAALSFLNARHDEATGDSNSAALNRQLERYEFLLADGLVKLAVGEWLTLFSAMSSSATTGSPNAAIRVLWANVLDSEEDGIGVQHGADCQKLAQFIRGSTPSQQLFMLDLVERFWIANELITDTAAWLAQQGVLLADGDFIQ